MARRGDSRLKTKQRSMILRRLKLEITNASAPERAPLLYNIGIKAGGGKRGIILVEYEKLEDAKNSSPEMVGFLPYHPGLATKTRFMQLAGEYDPMTQFVFGVSIEYIDACMIIERNGSV